MQNPFGEDALLRSLQGPLQRFIEPMLADARTGILRAMAGQAPPSFERRVRAMYDFEPAEVDALWAAAIEAAAELVGKGEVRALGPSA